MGPQGAGHEGPAQAAHRGDRGEEVDAAQWVSTEAADKIALLKVLGEKRKALAAKKAAGNDAYLKVTNTLSDNEESINTLEDQLKKILYELSDGKAYLKTTNCTLPQ